MEGQKIIYKHQDLKEMNIREELHPQENPSGKFYLPPAKVCYV